MIDVNDKDTLSLFPEKRRRGRPATGKAKTPAERKAAQRAREKLKPISKFESLKKLALKKAIPWQQLCIVPVPDLLLLLEDCIRRKDLPNAKSIAEILVDHANKNIVFSTPGMRPKN